MALTLALTTEYNGEQPQIIAQIGEAILATTPLTDLPNRAEALAQPYHYGPALFAALGGEELLQRLNQHSDKLLYLDIPAGDEADELAWECAIVPPRQFLVHRYGLLRLVDLEAHLDETPGPLRLIAQGADALVDQNGTPLETYRLDILAEMQAIERVLSDSQQAVQGVRIAPTVDALQDALSDDTRTLLHLSCHGDIIKMGGGVEAVLHLEDEHGGPEKLLGSDLMAYASLANLPLVVFSACRVGQTAGVIRTLVEQGITSAALGMQGLFPDPLADDLAAALYNSLLKGQSLGKAVQAARLTLRKIETAVGLPVVYVARGGDRPLPLTAGRATQQRLDLSQRCLLPTAVQLPDPFLGRNRELHELAKLAQDHKVITIIGTGGMGKTTLAAAFARRFALRYIHGVWGYSFADRPVDGGGLRRALLQRLIGDELADALLEIQETTILDQLRIHNDLLLLIDNYESVQQANEDERHPQHAESQAIHRLLAKIASNGGRLLLTSRRQPAGLKGEVVYPKRDHQLQGVGLVAGAELFYENSPRAKEARKDVVIQRLAQQVAQVTAGHPLAIALLGSEYDVGDVGPDRFLDNWATELTAAQSDALDAHHATFATALNRSFEALSPQSQERLLALSTLPFPFFVIGPALLWQLDPEEDDPILQYQLRELVNRSLLEIDTYDKDSISAIWRFQPAVQQTLRQWLTPDEQDRYSMAVAQYSVWLSEQAYDGVHLEGNSTLVRHVQPTLSSLVELADYLTGTLRYWHLQRVGWLLQSFGRTQDAYDLWNQVLSETTAELSMTQSTTIDRKIADVTHSVLYNLANIEMTRGNSEKALSLHEESMAFIHNLNIKDRAISWSMMAQIHLTMGDSEKALSLYRDSLMSFNVVGDIQSKAATLVSMADLYMIRGDWEKVFSLCEESLELFEKIGDIQGKAGSLCKMADVEQIRGDLEKALSLYRESLDLSEQIGDIRGKAWSLHRMAKVYLIRRDLEKSLSLYAESLELFEEIEDIKGRSWSLYQLARVYLIYGDLEEALSRCQESLALDEHIGDPNGRATCLEMMADIYMAYKTWHIAEELLMEAIEITQELGHKQSTALLMAKLGEVYQAQTKIEAAHEYYTQAHVLYQQLSMSRESDQIQNLLDSLEENQETLAKMRTDTIIRQIEVSAFSQLEAWLTSARSSKLTADERILALQDINVLSARLRLFDLPGIMLDDLTALIKCVAAQVKGEPLPPVPAAYVDVWAGWMAG